jgi:hypothetical protein
MALGRDVQDIAGNLKTVSMQLQLAPDRVVEIRVEYAPHRWELKTMMQAPGSKEWDVVSGPVICTQAVELSQVLQKLLAEIPVEAVGSDVRRGYRTLQNLTATTFDAVGEHVPE